MPKRPPSKESYRAPGVSVTITLRKVPAGYIKDIPIKGTASTKNIAAAVAQVIAARHASASGSKVKISIPTARIRKGERIKIGTFQHRNGHGSSRARAVA